MDTQPQQPNQPTIVDEFIVKVKLLTNEVYQFTIDPQTTKVSDLKRMILDKISIPLDKQRIVFGGKQLMDDNKVTDYVKQSGLTVHLIAKMNTQQSNNTNTTTNNTQSTTQQQTNTTANTTQNQTNNQQNNNNPLGGLLRGLGGLGSIGSLGGLGGLSGLGSTNPQTTTMTFTNMNDLNSSLGGLLGSLGIRLPQQSNQPTSTQQNQPRQATTQQSSNPFQTPPSNTYRPNQQQNQPTSSFTSNIFTQPLQTQPTQNQQPRPQNVQSGQQWNVSNEPILRLNQTISTLDLPSQPVLDHNHLSLRQQTAQYLRRLQHQYMRMIPQLNRSIQLLNQGRVTHLNEVLRLFESIDYANNHAEQAIRRLINLPVNQSSQQQNQNLPQVVQQTVIIGQGPANTQSTSTNTNTNTTVNNNQQQTQSNIPNVQVQTVQIELQGNQNLNSINDGIGNVQATIIIQQGHDIDDQIDQQPTIIPGLNLNANQNNSNNQSNQPRNIQSNIIGGTINLGGMGGLQSLLQGLTGQSSSNTNRNNQSQQSASLGELNLGGLMSMLGGSMGGGMNMNMQFQNQNQNRANQTQSTNTQSNMNNTFQQSTNNQQPQQSTQQSTHVHGPGCSHHHHTHTHQTHQPQPAQQPQQFPQIDLGNLASMANMFLGGSQQANTQQNANQSSFRPPQPQQNPMGGLMGIMSSLQQSGGMGQLMNTSLGQTLQQGGQVTIYSTIFKSFTGSDILTCFTSKNFDFLDRKYDNIRQNFLHAISIAGSQEDLVENITVDISDLLIPTNNVTNYQNCVQQVRTIIRRHVSQVVRVTLNKGDSKYSQKLLNCLKLAFCQAVEKIIASINTQTLPNGQSATGLVFHNLKHNSIELMNQFIEGLSGMFYGFIERDLIRVYNEYREQQKRKQQRSSQQVASEEQLLKQIDTQSKKDIEYLKNFKHSQYYQPKSQ